MRIGVLGGSFNPPHWGHLFVAEYVRDALQLDRVWLVVAPRPPHKLTDPELAPAEDRLAMVRLATSEAPALEASEIEFHREGPSYPVDTLEAIREAHPGARLYLILGADSLQNLPTWRNPERIAQMATLVAVGRPGWTLSPLPARWGAEVHCLEAPLIGISARDIRARVRQGRSIRFWVPEPVRRYIEERNLYRA
jgi:nicotinate-nucleotide adenylyltransferase